MKNVYLKAAELVEAHNGYSCLAIDEAISELMILSYERFVYAKLFKPAEDTYNNNEWGDHWGRNKKDCRVLALLFMHWISKDDENV